MKIDVVAVCGLGKVGGPILKLFREKGLNAVGYDIDPARSEGTLQDVVASSNSCLFIVQTPSLKTGAFSNYYLETALREFKKECRRQEKKDYLYIVSSTTVPGSCDQFRALVGDNICYKPEFIRLEFIHEDLRAPTFELIGSANSHAGDACETLYRKITDAPIKRMSLIEAELAKITLNCGLTTKISLANQLHLVAKKVGANADIIMEAVGSDPRIGNAYLKPGAPYGGPCLPRDNRMFRYFARTVGVSAWLSHAVDKVNEDVSR